MKWLSDGLGEDQHITGVEQGRYDANGTANNKTALNNVAIAKRLENIDELVCSVCHQWLQPRNKPQDKQGHKKAPNDAQWQYQAK